MRLVEIFVVVLAACGTACNVDKWDPPIQPSAEYPCTPFGKVCAIQHSCCLENEVCGGEPYVLNCPAGKCCDEGDVVFGKARGDAGARMTPQRPWR